MPVLIGFYHRWLCRPWLGAGCLGDKAFQSTSEVSNLRKTLRVEGKDKGIWDSYQGNRGLFAIKAAF